MDVVLLERIAKLGQMGDIVSVKPGYARNYLLPQKKALRATKENLAFFKTQRAQLEARNVENRGEAEAIAVKLEGVQVIVVRQAGETGQLYGSVSGRDIAAALKEAGFSVEARQVTLEHPIKAIGIHRVRVALHPEVMVGVSVNVARSEEEAALATAEDEDHVRAEAEAVFESAELAEQAVEELIDAPEEETEVETVSAKDDSKKTGNEENSADADS